LCVIGDHDGERALDLFIVEVVDNCASTVDDTRSPLVLLSRHLVKIWAHVNEGTPMSVTLNPMEVRAFIENLQFAREAV